MKSFLLVNLGCPKNLSDAENIASNLSNAGYSISAGPKADIAVINTCAFLSSAVKESKKVIEEYIELKKKGFIKKIIVAGCLVERVREKLLNDYPLIDAVIGINAIEYIESAAKDKKSYILPAEKNIPLAGRLLLTKAHSAYLKIADGCDNRCSYCAIPLIRGSFRSKKIEDIISETNALLRAGVKEVSLIAQDTTAYGKDLYGKPALKNLLKKLSGNKKIKWLRLMYMYPDLIDRDLLEIIKDSPNICHYFEMPIQHISDAVLKRMNRKSTEKAIKNKIELIRKIIPDMALRTTILSGFPGETDSDHRKVLNFIREYRFNNLAVFKYSRERGTPAFAFDSNLSAKIKKSRYEDIIIEQSRVVDLINKNIIGKKFELLMDFENCGRTYMDAVDIDGKIFVDKKCAPGTFCQVEIYEAFGYERKARVLNIKK